MARVIAGKIYGKVGDLVYSCKNGINYVKQVPKKSLKPPSEKQMIQWKKFGLVMRFLSPLSKLLNESCRNSSKTSGLHNAAKKNLADAITGGYPQLYLDYSKVFLIDGILEMPRLEMVFDKGLNEIVVSYNCNYSLNAFLNDELHALIYCPALPKFWHHVNTGLQRFEQIGVFKIPHEVIGHEIYIWLYMRSAVLDQFSNSLYMGKVSTQNASYEKD